MAGEEVQKWFREMPYKLRRELAGELRDIAEDAAAAVRSAAPDGPTGNTKASVRVTRSRNTLELNVEAGGPLTTKAVGGRKYMREIKIGAGEETQNVPKGAQSVTYDYALGLEYGNSHMPAHPFFYTTLRAKQGEINDRLQEAVAKVVAKL